MATAGSSLSASPSSVEPQQREEKERRWCGGLSASELKVRLIEKAAGEVLRGEVGGEGDKSASAALHLNGRLGQQMISQHSVGVAELRE